MGSGSRACKVVLGGLTALLAASCSSGPDFDARGLVPPPAACDVEPDRIGSGEQLEPVDEGNGCQIPNPWRMHSLAGVSLVNGAVLNCGMVGEVGNWIETVVQPAARSTFGEPVASMRVAASYSCRARNGVRGTKMSEHGFGNALDIASFTLASGRTVEVEGGWRGAGDERAFLHQVDTESCDHFSTVLGPDSDRYHHNHMHFDLAYRASGRRACR